MSKHTTLGLDAPLDVGRLIESRLLIQANSGAGKSWALRRLLEQTYAHVPQIVVDVEGEFHTLREKFDYVLAGQKGGDCPADIKSAALLARRLLELNVSAIVDIYELGIQRTRFVRLFLEALVNAPRDLWHPTLVVIDEAHMFAPEAGQAESADAVKDLMTRGRKRGFCGVLATQRISKLHKDAAAECNNKLIGRSSLDIDMKRAGSELGFTTREDMQRLRTLAPGTFYAFGPALSDEVRIVTVGPVQTTHPKAGERAAAPTPPREKVKKILAQLADLPHEAEEEARTVAEWRTKAKQLEVELKKAKAEHPVETKVVEKPVVTSADIARIEKLADRLDKDAVQLDAQRDRIAQAQQAVVIEVGLLRSVIAIAITANRSPQTGRSVNGRSVTPTPRPAPQVRDRAVVGGRQTQAQKGVAVGETTPISNAELRILEACAWAHSIGLDAPDARVVAFLAGYTVNGHFTNLRGKLHTAGLVEYPSGGTVRLTAAGRDAAPDVTRPVTTDELHRAVMARLDGAKRRILAPLIEVWPDSLPAEDLAERAGYTVNGHFTNLRGRLRTMGLVTYPSSGEVRAADLLFPEGA